MTPTTAAEKVKQIIETWEHATNHAPTGEWSADIFLASPAGSRLVGELEEDIMGLFKITFTDCWEMDDRIDADQRWLAHNDRLKIVVTAPTKEQAFEEVMISLRVMTAYESNFDISKSINHV